MSGKKDDCASACATVADFDDLNRDCFCVAVDTQALHARLESELAAHGLPLEIGSTHPHLFSALPVYVSRRHIEQASRVVTALESIVALPAYQQAVLEWAPDIARFNPGSPGGLLGLDFHVSPDGLRLIEINTNPGGVLLTAMLGQAQRPCMPQLSAMPTDAALVEDAVVKLMIGDWNQQPGHRRSAGLVAIVDDTPARQYLFPEFLLFRELLRKSGLRAEICAPEDLLRTAEGLFFAGKRVDFVYNRLTDFALHEPGHLALREAYLASEISLSPHPRAHALYADKRNLTVLGDRNRLHEFGASESAVEELVEAIPHTQLLTGANRDALWERRRHLFFKPAAGFGSKASYRGDKLTHRVWKEMAGTAYVAQAIVAPSERHVGAGAGPLKVDIRCYAYAGRVISFAARMYQGQTTNFRTQGGGFAPVLTSSPTDAAGIGIASS